MIFYEKCNYIGETLIKDITTGKYAEIKGVVPGTIMVAYVYQIKVRIGNLEFGAPVAMADSNDVPAIFGRADALDRFDANFSKGEEGKTSVGRINKEANVKTGAVLRGKTNTVAAAPFISG